MMRTLSPLVMSAWASEYSVASLPWALTTEMSDEEAGVLHGLVRYGASNST